MNNNKKEKKQLSNLTILDSKYQHMQASLFYADCPIFSNTVENSIHPHIYKYTYILMCIYIYIMSFYFYLLLQ